MDKKRKYILIVAIMLLVVLTVIGSTIAFFGWTSEEEATIDVTVTSGTGSCTLKTDNNVFIEPSATRNGGRIIRLNARQELAAKASITWTLVVNEISGLQDQSFKYEMINASTGASYGSGTFENITSGSTITFSNNQELLGFYLDYTFTLYLWIDGNTIGGNSLDMADRVFYFDINCNIASADTGELMEPSESLATHITNLYLDNVSSTPITHPFTSSQYYYAESVGLMNDGLDVDGNRTEDIKTEGNIRYYGATPDNYIYFNCDDYSNQSSDTCERWRIIGVFDDKVKIIRDETIGKFAKDNTGIEGPEQQRYFDNDWHNSSLLELLNRGGYYYNEDVVYYNNEWNDNRDGNYPYLSESNFKTRNIGLKNSITRNLISNSVWYLGGTSHGSLYADEFYVNERQDAMCDTCTYDSTIKSKVFVIYASDYGFASDFSVCSSNLSNYDNNNCISTNWIYKPDYTQAIINPDTRLNYAGYYISKLGYFARDNNSIGYNVRPTLYLNYDLRINDIGSGAYNNPYQLIIE